MKTIRRPISILLAILMVVGMFTVLPISAGAAPPESGSSGSMETGTTITPSAATWTFKLNSNFSGEWNADTDVVSEQPVELNLAAGDYEFQIVAYEDGNLSSYRGNEVAGSFTENYSQIMYDNGGNAKFHADGGKYTLTYNAGDGVATIAPVYVAQIGATKYKTLADAIAAAQTDDTITLLEDIALTGANWFVVDNKDVTIDLGGKNISSEDSVFVLKNGADLTVKNGTMTTSVSNDYAIYVNNGSIFTLDNDATLKATASRGNGIIVRDGGEAVINGTIESGYYSIAGFGSAVVDVNAGASITSTDASALSGNGSDGNEGYTFNINGGTLTSVNDVAIYHPNQGTLNITGGTITGATAIYVKSGTTDISTSSTSISGATITGNGAAKELVHSGNGCNPTGDAIVIENCGYPGGAPAIDISGGTIVSENADPVHSYGYNDYEPIEKFVSGGTFNKAVPAEYCAEGYDPVDDGDGNYTVAPHEHDWDYENVTWNFTESASHIIYAKYTLTCKTDPTHTKEQTGSGTMMLTVAVDGDKFVYSHSAVKIDGNSVAVPNYTRNIADGIINQYELKAAVKVAGNYKLANDITGFTDNVNPVDGFVLDGQNHMIKYGTINASNRVMFVAADQNTKFTLKNITLDGNNKAKWAVCAYTGNSGNNAGNVITLDTVTIQNFKSNDYVGAINAFGSSTWNLKDCTITGNTTVDDSDGLSGSAVWAGSKATINIDGGTYDEVYLHSYSGTGAVLNADGGATIDNLVLDLTKTDTLKANIDEATVGAITSNEGTIPEEAVVMDPAKATVAAPEGYKWVDSDETGMKTLAQIVYVAQIGETKYETLEAAFAAAVDGDTITLLADCAGNGIKVTPAGKFATGLTVDFDGHTYTVDGETVGSPGTETLAFQLLKNNKVTFKNGTIYSEKAKMLVQNYCDLTLDNMTLTLNNTSYEGAYTLSNNNGSAVINDTTINANPTTGSFAFDVCRYSSYPSIDVTVTGDSVINGDVEISASKGQAKDGFSLTLESGTMTGNIVVDPTAQSLIGEDNNVTKANSFTQEAPADFKWVDNGDGTSSLVAKDYVAQVGTTKYETLQDALDVVPDGGTVTVLKNITTSGNIFADGYVSGGNRTYTVDLGGYTVSGGTFIVADGNTVTFTNGTIESASYGIQNTATAIIDDSATVTSTATNASAVYGAAGSTTIIDGTVEGNKYGVIVRGGTLDVAGTVTATDTGIDAIEGGVANINDGADVSSKFAVVAHKDSVINVEDGAEITGTSHAISGNGKAADGPYTINVTGGTLTATEGAGIYNPNAQGTLNISGGTVTGTTAVIAGENATTSISGGTFNTPVPENYCAEGYVPKDNGDGTYTVEEEVKDLFVGYGLTLHGDIGLIFYLDPTAVGLTANQVTSVSVDFTCDQYSGNYTASGNDLEKDGNYIKVKYYVPAAYMASDITAYNVKFNNLPVVCDDDTDTYSVQEYAQRIMANPVECGIPAAKADAAVTLMKEMLNYGAKAKAVFETQMANPEDAVYDPIPEYTMANVTANVVAEKIKGTATDMSGIHPEPDANFYSPSVVYLSKTTLRMVFLIPTGNGSTCTDEYDGHQGVWYYWAEVTDIPAAELDEQQEFEVNGVEFNYSALDYVKAVLNSNMDPANKALAASLFLYNQAANAYYSD